MAKRSWPALVAVIALVSACGGSTTEADSSIQYPDGHGNAEGNGQDVTEAFNWDDKTDLDGQPTDQLDQDFQGQDGAYEQSPWEVYIPENQGDANQSGNNYFPSHELYVKIMGPSSGPTASALGNVTNLGGVVFGQYTSLKWTNSTGAQGSGTGAPYWKTGPILLAPGDNLLTVEASDGTQTARDSIIVTYNTGFRWDDALRTRPPTIFAGESVDVIVTAPMTAYTENTVQLIQVDENGNTIKSLGTMKDTGVAPDEIQGDGIFTGKATFSSSQPDTIRLRATALVTAGAQVYTAYSEVKLLPVLAHLTKADCDAMVAVAGQVAQQIKQAVDGGTDPVQVRDQALAALQGSGLVSEAGPASENGTGLWVRWSNGVLGAFHVARPGTRGGEGAGDQAQVDGEQVEEVGDALVGLVLGSKHATLFSPFSVDFPQSDEAAEFKSRMSPDKCPPFEVSGPLVGSAAGTDALRAMSIDGVAVLVTHGDALFHDLSAGARAAFRWEAERSVEVLWTGEAPVCANLLQSKKTCTITQGGSPTGGCPAGTYCLATQNSGNSVSGVCYDPTQVDLRLGHLAVGGTYAMLPSFVEAHSEMRFPGSMVYLGACRSLFNGTLAAALFARGVKTIFGYTGAVSSAFAFEQGKALAQKLLDDRVTTGDAFTAGQHDPQNPTTSFMMFGADNLDLNDSGIVSPSFENGTLQGWTPQGDGRVISKLGPNMPVAGKFMGVTSTGMGYTLAVGSFKQRFCIPPDKNTIQFYWNYLSEEFQEYCGSKFQDPFTAKLESSAGNVTLLDINLDKLCQGGSMYVGLKPAGVEFDVETTEFGANNVTYMTGWQKLTKDVTVLAQQNKPVDLRFYVTDEGDSRYDTVILIDDIRFLKN